MSLVSVPGDQITLLEKAPTRPSNDLMAYIAANTGGNASPYVLTPGPTYVTGSSLPAAPEGTKRVTMTVDGAAYFPLVAPCPAVSCTNGDPIANAIPDAGTKAYNEAVARKTEREIEIFTAGLGLVGAAVHGVTAVSNLATKASAAARVAEVAGANTERLLQFNSKADPIFDSVGHAAISHPQEYKAIMADLQRNGVNVKYGESSMSFSPNPSGGSIGNEILLPNEFSISALRHEYGHFLDHQALGSPKYIEYFKNPELIVATERSQYLNEIRFSRQIGDDGARRTLIENYFSERNRTITNYYQRPYGGSYNPNPFGGN